MMDPYPEPGPQPDLTMEAQANRQIIGNQICRSFNCDELRSVCYALGVVYEELNGRTCRQKAQALIRQLDSEERLPDLIAECRLLRPHDRWSEAI